MISVFVQTEKLYFLCDNISNVRRTNIETIKRDNVTLDFEAI